MRSQFLLAPVADKRYFAASERHEKSINRRHLLATAFA